MSAQALTSHWIDNGFGHLVFSPLLDWREAYAYQDGQTPGGFEYAPH